MEDTTQQATPDQPAPQKEQNTGMAVVAYIIFFIPLLTDTKNDPFVRYHVQQGLVLFIGWLVAMVLSWIPVIMLFGWLLHIGLFVLMILGIINAVNGKQVPLPLIGQFADMFKI
jgi:uncharacterized membrane protein